MQAIQELDLGEDTCNINQYIDKRMQNNDISEIRNMERLDISPAAYYMLQNSQPTSASVERSFPTVTDNTPIPGLQMNLLESYSSFVIPHKNKHKISKSNKKMQ